MSVDSKHPDWTDRREEWLLMRHSARGETAIKNEGSTYLPVPSGFGDAKTEKATRMYGAYRKRAQFPEIVGPTVAGMVGVIHRNQFQIDMPEGMNAIIEKATKDGLTLDALHRRVTRELLLMGRFALLADAPAGAGGTPYLTGYCAEHLINWSEERDFFVLDESGKVRKGFEWVDQKRYLVLEIKEGRYEVTDYKDGAQKELNPTARGGKVMAEIPLVVIGANDLSVDPEDAPLIGVARAAVNLYQLSADYRWQLFMSGQETLFVINGDAPDMVGAGVTVSLKGTKDLEPDAKYVGPECTGIAAHRLAIIDERTAAAQAGAKMFDAEQKTAESGDALRLRFTAQTATLKTVANASAAGLEKALRYVATMMGLNPLEVIVKPPQRLIDTELTPADALDIIKGWQERGYSYETMYENLQRGGIASPDRTAEDELKLIEKEDLTTGRNEEEDESDLPPRREAA